MSEQRPVPMTRTELHALLLDMARRAEVGDSYSGTISYDAMDPDMPADADFMVFAMYRVGNLEGQGGTRIVGNVG